ncbi:MAG: squalene synthase HpnC [Nitrospirae bacterium]|nr:squalene synthase HpnC [Nitrospirota bacterium]
MSEASNAFNYCSKVALEHYENFPVGSWLIPRNKRKYVHAIYAFARTADDFADEAGYGDDERELLLADWEKRLDECVTGNPNHPVFISIKEAIERFHIPDSLLRDLITAFKMDTVNKRYLSMSDVLNYCRYSANPVGRIILSLFEYRDPELHRLSDFICTALQLTNFWQDIAIDLKKDRVYIPLEDMKRFGYTVNELKSHTLNDSFRALLSSEIEFTRDLFNMGRPLCTSVRKGLSIELQSIWSGGMKILEKIEHNGYDIFTKRPVITTFDKINILLRALTTGH